MEINFILTITLIICFCIVSFYLGQIFTKKQEKLEIHKLVERQRKEAINCARHILKGQFNEQLSPFNSDFKYKPSECRFFGAPIDLVCFEGIDKKQVNKIIFIEVKSGNSSLSEVQKSIKNTIKKGNVEFYEYIMK